MNQLMLKIMKTRNKPIPYSDIRVGMLVKDFDEELGIGMVIKCDDIHNVFVEYLNGGSGLCCLDEKCADYDPLYYI